MLNYFIQLIFNIYISAFHIIKSILFESKSNIAIVSTKTDVKNEMYQTAIANSITLTPGTITLDKKGNTLTVLCFNPESEISKLKEQVLNPFETIILKKGK